MARLLIITLSIVTLITAQFPTYEQAAIELPAAEVSFGNLSSDAIYGQESTLNLLGRQTCAAGYGICANTGECCLRENTNKECCGRACLSRRAAGTKCCSDDGAMCAPQWRCCGSGCSPEAGQCCDAQGHYCPNANWKCCGNQGKCYPHEDFQCCSNAGEYCPKNTRCVYCRGSTTRICCRGLDTDVEKPVFDNPRPSGNNDISAVPNPQPTQAPIEPGSTEDDNQPGPTQNNAPTTERIITRITETERTTQRPIVEEATTRYYSTTFTYSFVVWTRITEVQSVIVSTMETTTTILSVLATNSFAALAPLRSAASAVQTEASRAAVASRPLNTAPFTTTRSTSTTTSAVAGGGSVGGGTSAGRAVEVQVLGLFGIVIVVGGVLL